MTGACWLVITAGDSCRWGKVHGISEVRAARARAQLEMRHDPVRVRYSLQARCDPGAPRLLARLVPFPCLAPASRAAASGRGRSSSDGGSEEFPEFRDAARSSRASRSSRSATRAARCAFCCASIPMSWPCSAISASRAASSGLAVTDHHHPGIPSVIKRTR